MATLSSELLHSRVLKVASSGLNVGVTVHSSPTLRVYFFSTTLMEAIGTKAVTEHSANAASPSDDS